MPRHSGIRMGDSQSSSSPVVAESSDSLAGVAAAAEAPGPAAPLLAAADGLQVWCGDEVMEWCVCVSVLGEGAPACQCLAAKGGATCTQPPSGYFGATTRFSHTLDNRFTDLQTVCATALHSPRGSHRLCLGRGGGGWTGRRRTGHGRRHVPFGWRRGRGAPAALCFQVKLVVHLGLHAKRREGGNGVR